MFKAQFKKNTPFESWTNIGSYSSEKTAISAALRKKRAGALLVRVVDKKGAIIYTG